MFGRMYIPSTIPRNPLDNFVSCMVILSIVPFRTPGSEFTSSTAASMATFATFPMEELKDKIAPMFTTSGLVETPVPVLIKCPLHKIISRSQNICMVDYCTAKKPNSLLINIEDYQGNFRYRHVLQPTKLKCMLKKDAHTYKHAYKIYLCMSIYIYIYMKT